MRSDIKNVICGIVIGSVIGWWVLFFQVQNGNCILNTKGIDCHWPKHEKVEK